MRFVFFLLASMCCIYSHGQPPIVLQLSGSELFVAHKIVSGESFLKIGSLYNVSPVKLAQYNGLTLSSTFAEGQFLKIPITNTNFEQGANKGAYEVLIPLAHEIKNAENLDGLLKFHPKLSMALLQEWNPGLSRIPKAGTKVIVGHLRVKKELAKYFNYEESKEVEISSIKPVEVVIPNNQSGSTIETFKSDTQKDFDSDELLAMAKKAAFDNKNYPLASEHLRSAIFKSPNYADLRIFLGRIYTWTDKIDSARQQFSYVINLDPTYKDAFIAFADLENWNDRPLVALNLIDQGLKHNPSSKELLQRKVKLLGKLNRQSEALHLMDSVLKADPKNTEMRAMSAQLRETIGGNRIGVSYDYTYFDRQFDDPWHIASLEYSKSTKLGSISARLNYANRFKSNGLQYELEAYPNISRTLYSYVSFAYSDDVGVFPNYRGGFSLYSTLPKSFEGEIGFRYLKFSEDPTWIYTAALGKYYKSWLFTARTYLTPGTSNISHSYNLGARYYYGGAFDFVGLVLGTGISPDESRSALLLNSKYKLLSKKASATYKHEIKNKYIITLNASLINNEYLPQTTGNQIEGGISYQIRF